MRLTQETAPAGVEHLLFSVCICTRRRPDDLRRCLQSTQNSGVPLHEVIVSDDDPDATARPVCEEFANVRWVPGPARGLCANRNRALEEVSGSHVLFLDDDAELAPDFLLRVRRLLSEDRELGARLIVTGRERRDDGHVTAARAQSLLGHQERAYGADDPRDTVVINAAVFPVALFAHLRFDERIRYGYDEVDLTTRAVALGFAIIEDPLAINLHHHSTAARGDYESVTDASRLFVTHRRLRDTERRPMAARGYLALASAHLVAARLRAEGPAGLGGALSALKLSRQMRRDLPPASR